MLLMMYSFIIISSIHAKGKRRDMLHHAPIMFHDPSSKIHFYPFLSLSFSDHELRHGSSRVSEPSSPCCSLEKTLDVSLPLWNIRPFNPSVVCQKSVHFSLNIGRLRPHAATAGEKLDLLLQFGEELMGSIIVGLQILVDFISLIDRINRCLNVPQAKL